MNSLLAPCPYCFGTHPEMHVHLIGCQVVCPKCLATGPSKSSRKEASLAWNQLSDELAKSRQWYANDFVGKLKEVEESMRQPALKKVAGRL